MAGPKATPKRSQGPAGQTELGRQAGRSPRVIEGDACGGEMHRAHGGDFRHPVSVDRLQCHQAMPQRLAQVATSGAIVLLVVRLGRGLPICRGGSRFRPRGPMSVPAARIVMSVRPVTAGLRAAGGAMTMRQGRHPAVGQVQHGCCKSERADVMVEHRHDTPVIIPRYSLRCQVHVNCKKVPAARTRKVSLPLTIGPDRLIAARLRA